MVEKKLKINVGRRRRKKRKRKNNFLHKIKKSTRRQSPVS
jgi:hypothetical protein